MSSSKYIQVVEDINRELRVSELSGNIGLHAGTSGIALFIAYYDRIISKKTEVSQRVYDIMEHNINLINSGYRQHTICNGISGFVWLCEHLRKLRMLKGEDIEFIDDLDPFLFRMMIADIQGGNYDFLHGAIGVGTYFISRFKKNKVQEYLEVLLYELEKSGIPCENGAIKWISVLNIETGKKGYNICLSHGMSSIVAFLVRLYQLNFEIERVDRLLNQTIIYVLDQITYTDGNLSYFPSTSKESSEGNNYSRLGWCYGDLGIAHILWQASLALKNEEWENASIRILNHTSNRRNFPINGIRDAGLCHGSAGVAHIFRNLYLHTGLKVFQEAADYWYQATMQMAKYEDGIVGFKAWRKEEYGGPEKSDTLLEGIAGIGIAMLSNLNSNELAWDECFMLSY